MKIYNNIHDFRHVKCPVVTVGTFDGVHLGHQQIIARLNQVAQQKGGESVVVTFDPHPRMVLTPNDKAVRLINIAKRKYEHLQKAGVQHLIVLPFTLEFAKTPWQDFIKDVIVDQIKAAHLVIGYDHRFGAHRHGSHDSMIEMAKLYGFGVEEVDEFLIDGIQVSSTRIRQALNGGFIREANRLLGYEYSITGLVVHGNRIGHQLGFPTANIETDDKFKLIAANGVYASRVEWNGKIYEGMSNIGIRPTINDFRFAVEVNIFDFDQDIYGECLTVYFIDRIRDEVRFATLEELSKQLAVDKLKVKQLLKEGR